MIGTLRAIGFACGLAAVALVAAVAPPSGHAEEAMPATGPALEKRLATYDPRAVAAVRHYFESPAIHSSLVALTNNMNKAVVGALAKQNPGLDPKQADDIQRVVGDAVKERLGLLTQMNMVVALDTFSTEELVAMDAFYTSPTGAGILAKLPKMMSHLPGMIQAIMPDYMSEVKTKLQVAHPELKL